MGIITRRVAVKIDGIIVIMVIAITHGQVEKRQEFIVVVQVDGTAGSRTARVDQPARGHRPFIRWPEQWIPALQLVIAVLELIKLANVIGVGGHHTGSTIKIIAAAQDDFV
ncbi:hypothetical protein D3C76_1515280 [compost metagenome]